MQKTYKRQTALFCDLCGEYIAQAKSPEALKYCRHTVITGAHYSRIEVPYFNEKGEELGVEVREIERKQSDIEICDKCAAKLWAQADETRARLMREKRPKVVY